MRSATSRRDIWGTRIEVRSNVRVMQQKGSEAGPVWRGLIQEKLIRYETLGARQASVLLPNLVHSGIGYGLHGFQADGAWRIENKESRKRHTVLPITKTRALVKYVNMGILNPTCGPDQVD